MAEFPSQHREGADHVWSATPTDKSVALSAIVEKSGLEKAVVQRVLKLAATASVAEGLNGKWSRAEVSRTAWRDAVVLAAIQAGDTTMTKLVESLAGLASRPQINGSVVRLRAAGLAVSEKTETRSPVLKAL